MSTAAPAATSPGRRGAQAVMAAWARCRMPSTRATRRARRLGTCPVQARMTGPGAQSRAAPYPARASGTASGGPAPCARSRTLAVLARHDFPGLGQQAFTQDAPGVRVALQQRRGCVLDLLEGGVRRNRRHVGVCPEVEHRRAVGGEGLVPGGTDLLRLVHRDAVQAKAAGESFVGDVGELLRL